MPVVWSDRCLLHEPAAEIWVGVPGPAAETPARAQAILDALDARVVDADPHPDKALLARRPATAVWARPGWFAYDTMTLVGSGTWEAARAAADAALTAGSGAGHRAACILAG